MEFEHPEEIIERDPIVKESVVSFSEAQTARDNDITATTEEGYVKRREEMDRQAQELVQTVLETKEEGNIPISPEEYKEGVAEISDILKTYLTDLKGGIKRGENLTTSGGKKILGYIQSFGKGVYEQGSKLFKKTPSTFERTTKSLQDLLDAAENGTPDEFEEQSKRTKQILAVEALDLARTPEGEALTAQSGEFKAYVYKFLIFIFSLGAISGTVLFFLWWLGRALSGCYFWTHDNGAGVGPLGCPDKDNASQCQCNRPYIASKPLEVQCKDSPHLPFCCDRSQHRCAGTTIADKEFTTYIWRVRTAWSLMADAADAVGDVGKAAVDAAKFGAGIVATLLTVLKWAAIVAIILLVIGGAFKLYKTIANK